MGINLIQLAKSALMGDVSDYRNGEYCAPSKSYVSLAECGARGFGRVYAGPGHAVPKPNENAVLRRGLAVAKSHWQKLKTIGEPGDW